MRIEWTAGALADLEAIHAYVARDSPTNAQSLIDRIVRAAQPLVDFTNFGRRVPEWHGEPPLREVLTTRHRIIYLVESDRIAIVAVIDGRRLLDPAMFEHETESGPTN